MKIIIGACIAFISLLNARRYFVILKKDSRKEKKADPSLAMWFLFAFATTLSTVSLLFNSSWNWEAAAYGVADMIMCYSVSIGIVRSNGNRIVLDAFEKWYIVAIFGALLFWVFSGSSFNTNIVAQLLLVAAYYPTVRKMVKEKRNTEPFSIWVCSFAGSALSLYLSIESGKWLAIAYSIRSIVLTAGLLSLMYFFERRNLIMPTH